MISLRDHTRRNNPHSERDIRLCVGQVFTEVQIQKIHYPCIFTNKPQNITAKTGRYVCLHLHPKKSGTSHPPHEMCRKY